MLKKNLFALFTSVLLFSCGNQPSAEDCTDQIDNDNDGDIDCADSECAALPACQVNNPVCGDGVAEGDEACDGADLKNKTCADFGLSLGALSCNAQCQLDTSSCTNPSCGNGIIEGNEPCDDGNNSNTDACLKACALASCGDGFTQIGTEGCDDSNTTAGDGCNALCQLESCGDGVIQAPETCDDTNTNNNDDCLNTCQTASCGDSVIQSNVEGCDDGNQLNNDGCNALCQLESCGDGVVQPPETCDDANANNNDGCNAQCQIESCGDGVVQSPETCDDQNADNSDACIDNCQLASCGDGFTQLNIEECDDENQDDNDGCSATCVIESCGDGVVQSSEACDDQNNNNNDGCAGCQISGGFSCSGSPSVCTLLSCGDGILDIAEVCDDGNASNGDGCSSSCQFELSCAANETTVVLNVEDLGLLIPDADLVGVESTLQVPLAGTVKKVQVGIGKLSHTFPGDLDLLLRSPQGTERSLFSLAGASGVGFFSTLLTDAAPLFVEANLSPFTGVFRPHDSLAISSGIDFANQDAAGGWTLKVTDHFAIDEGTLDNWSLLLCVDPTASVCGDGVISGAEECDDNNANNNDGCSSLCKTERCGDGVVSLSETCDDGNNIDGDGCESDCLLLCGNNTPNATAALLDASTGSCFFSVNQGADWQTAESLCEAQGGHLAVTESAAEESTVLALATRILNAWIGVNDLQREANSDASLFAKVTGGLIGSGFRNFGFGEPNQAFDEDCVQFKAVEAIAWNDAPCGLLNPFICEIESSTCGDGATQGSETCDDGNAINNDGCNKFCRVEFCGDGTTQESEGCDDGNTNSNDGCSATCALERCGDGIVQPNEECDDTNNDNTDDCPDTCRVATCGDGFLFAGFESCDDGNNSDGDGCNRSCDDEFCGDGIVNNTNETCDDGDTANGDGCDASCQVEFCGDGIVNNREEECDDGNTNNADGCTQTCKIEADCDAVTYPTATRLALDPSSGHCLADFTQTLNWLNAETLCESLGGYLVVPNSDAENTLARSLTVGTSAAWIGLTDLAIEAVATDQAFRRVTGGALITGFSNFQVGEPNNSGSNEDCAEFIANSSRWNDQPCTSTRTQLVCEFEANPCGDGIVQPNFAEICDDGNTFDGDGCSGECQEESGPCINTIPAKGIPSICDGTSCGNGVVDAAEQCDDANTNPNDGCDACASTINCASGETFISIDAAGLPLAINDLTTTTSTLDVAVDGSLRKVAVLLSSLTHTFPGDLSISLTSPAGTNRTLSSREGGGVDNFISTLLIDGADFAIEGNPSAPFTGSFRPMQSLSTNTNLDLTGQNTNGTWALSVSDEEEFDIGALNAWRLLLCVDTSAVCGNGVVDAGEGCDDANTTSGDGCSLSCQREECGDGLLQSNEECDDHNLFIGDGCSSACQFELSCAPNETLLRSSASPALALPDGVSEVTSTINIATTGHITRVGVGIGELTHPRLDNIDLFLASPDGVQQTLSSDNGARSDDHRSTLFLDSASTSITTGSGPFTGVFMPEQPLSAFINGSPTGDWVLTARDDKELSTGALQAWTLLLCVNEAERCGDGTTDSVEQCDDGNQSAGDGCSPLCQLEVCGNGVVDIGEACDDANTLDNDGCSSLCQREVCGDGAAQSSITAFVTSLDFIFLATGCDDAGLLTFTINGQTALVVESDPNCTCLPGIDTITITDPKILSLLVGGTNNFTVQFPLGDLLTARLAWAVALIHTNDGAKEVVIFDQGNGNDAQNRNPDLCLAGSDGSGQVKSSSAQINFLSEECDDGNNINGDSCDNNCTATACGNNITTAGEACDDGNNIDTDLCRNDCTTNPCGNGVLDPGEECDDFNRIDGDGCSSQCVVEAPCVIAGAARTQTDPFSGHCFAGFTQTVDWRFAEASCIKVGGHLAVIDNADENNTARAALNNNGGWLGYNDFHIEANTNKDNFKKVTGGFIDGGFQNFAAGQPGNNNTGFDCVTMNTTTGEWSDSPCQNTRTFVCEIEQSPCGDGIAQPSRGEQCDDGNFNDNDGCDAACQFESGCGPNDTEVILTASNLALAIPDNNTSGAISTFNVTTAGTVKKVRVGLNQITHTSDSQLDISLLSPQGTRRDLSSDNGNSDDNYTGTLFSDATPFSITLQNRFGPYSGVFQPEQSLSAGADLLNQNAQGNWSLNVVDDTATLTGTIDAWTLLLCIDPTSAVCGDNIISGAEECDGGNATNNDGCSSLCKLERCGDGIKQANEQCDDGNLTNNDGCEANCTLACGASVAGAKLAIEDPNTGSCSFLVEQTLNWASAESTCEAQGGHLVVNESIKEEDVIQQILTSGIEIYIGITDQTSEALNNANLFGKVTGGLIGAGFRSFNDGEPNQFNGLQEDCAEYNNTRWNDAVCTNNRRFICEIEADPCGDGVLQPNFAETCDDANLDDGDGCSSACTIEPGFSCTNTTPAIGTPSLCL